ncbi:sporulation integral membrane protein YtvI [Romboutsia maritimum]|uniref:Sporulation integral membrane protein YtvI n=1 Tax=Romboutsia maritimum TaxID=2020948 RepID=A0A371ISH0_9FIRM|nr:sporulation integral membrane protein YtvI [Romboutsia maritimum]RDY23403.1 sporulation integral membrane protein YtvI [Romboutsia maritimum]
MSILDRKFLYKFKCNIIFIIIYSIFFILTYETFPYIAPFLVGGIIAFIINPISQKLKNKFRIDKGVSTLVLSFFGVAIVITFTTLLIMSGTKHLMYFLNNITSNSNNLNEILTNLLNQATVYIEYFEDVSNFDVEKMITKYSREIIELAKGLLASIISLATSIPYIVIFIITLFISTYFIAKDIDIFEYKFYNMFTESAKRKVKNIKKEIIFSVLGYIKAYTILMGITFITIWGSFSFFGVPYGLLLGFIGALLDLIPFLGIMVIFVPVTIYYFIVENYFIAVSISIVFITLSLLRQVLEPKLVSANIGLSPLATVAAIFIGVQVKGIVGIIFCLGLVIMHDILKKVEIL